MSKISPDKKMMLFYEQHLFEIWTHDCSAPHDLIWYLSTWHLITNQKQDQYKQSNIKAKFNWHWFGNTLAETWSFGLVLLTFTCLTVVFHIYVSKDSWGVSDWPSSMLLTCWEITMGSILICSGLEQECCISDL